MSSSTRLAHFLASHRRPYSLALAADFLGLSLADLRPLHDAALARGIVQGASPASLFPPAPIAPASPSIPPPAPAPPGASTPPSPSTSWTSSPPDPGAPPASSASASTSPTSSSANISPPSCP